MKKVLLAIAVIALIGCASCSKSKDCKCTATVGAISVDLGTTHLDEGDCSDLETTFVGYQFVSCKKI